MDKLKMQTVNKADENFKKLADMFPNAVTEAIDENGEVVRAIDKDVLMQEISCKVVDGNEERYQFTWPDKKKSVLLANAPINKTLRPCREESVDFDNTENLYIEGDNLEVLKLLQETYLGKIKMIYIDPPYNTGNDFVYEDDFAQSTDEYLANSGQYDDEGNRLVKNLDSNGRFHTDWLNMIYPRLKIAKDLLSDDGVIFISIDDHEVENLKKLCGEIFGEQNFEGHIHWRRRHNQPNDKTKMIAVVTEHIIVYAKNSTFLKNSGVGKLDLTAKFSNPDNDPKGPWASKPWKTGSDQNGSKYTIVTPSGKVLDGEWMGDETTYKRFLAEGRMYFPKNGDGMPRKKYYQFEREGEGQCATNWWSHEQFSHNQAANDCMTEMFGEKNVFSNPKPVELIRAMIKISNAKNESIILDFFSGSATTAHAVMQLNAEDGGHRKFIMVQLPEETDEKSEAYKAGYKNICEIGKERIRRAGKKMKENLEQNGTDIRYLHKELKNAPIKNICGFDVPVVPARWGSADETEENKAIAESLDIGFRVLKCDSSNMKDVYYNPAEYESSLFSSLEDNIKEDRTPDDLLFQVMLDLGVLLSSKIEETIIAGKKVFNVEDNYLIVCFDDNVTEDVITEIAKQKPYYFVMRDSSMANDSVATNFEQIFATYSPDTVRKVL
ncbi:site-specific DNA-methyltransferase [Eubacterium sp.]|uniref:site-specific DNA-methyltransferase n=1 Tax=Eubacterium sp. TaxID=142586 RepID=UPI0039943DDA